MYSRISDITTLDLAITSVCNARCMDCARWWVDDEGTQYHNPRDDHMNQHWPWRDLCDHMSVLTAVRQVLICGNAGDPMSHANIADICEWITQQWPGVYIEIDTNGSLGTAQTYQRLSQLGTVHFRFAVDGLADTNHIYRRRVPWHRVVNNIKLWHSLGGDATLKTIDFPWNEPDRDQIRAWADGMDWGWRLEPRWNPDIDQRIMNQSDDTPSEWQWPLEEGRDWQSAVSDQITRWRAMGQPMQAECKSRSGDWLYINHDHKVWPCCYWSNSEYVQWEVQKKHLQHLQRVADPTWNSLDHRSLTDIIQHPIMQGIERLWHGTDIDNTSSICMAQCGGCASRE